MNSEKQFKRKLLPACMALATLTVFSVQAYAAEEEAVTEVTVTGSRIVSSSFTQPTPTTSMTVEDIQKSAQPNVFTAIAQLPSLQGSASTQAMTYSTSSGLQGLSSFGLRGLGTIRTLTLLDGQRVVGANVTGVTDVSQFPQLLIKSVDVVTGGASASYGSDAVGGVVNFITDKRFEGVKGNIQAGQSTYADNEGVLGQIAWGGNFMDDRLHIQLSGEHGKEDGIPPGDFGLEGPGGRDWYTGAEFASRQLSETTDGKPQRYLIDRAQNNQYAKYGLITGGPLKGIAFGENGEPYQFQYGKNCIANLCEGGDLSGLNSGGKSLASAIERTVGYARIGFDLDENNEIYATINKARVASVNYPILGAAKNANLTMKCDNPYLPASIKAACAANNITQFQYGTVNAQIEPRQNVHPVREQERFVVGADGKFNAFGTEWSYDTYYQYGRNVTDLKVHDIMLNNRYNAAIDAIQGPNGTIVCRNPAAQASGCVPMNIFGNVAPSAASYAYVFPENGPHQHSPQMQNVASFNISGEPFSSWAGPIAVAAGLEYRKEEYIVTGDPYGNGNRPESPNNAQYPADPVLTNPIGNHWFAGNYHWAKGEFDVKEAYLEANLPVIDSDTMGEANINMAIRGTDYSTAGNVDTWKLGATWKTPVSGLRFRAVTSKDVRAPNLSELFAAEVVINNTVNYKGTNITVQQRTVGNPDLRVEDARNQEFGIVLAQPDWAPGLNLSIDYFDIKVDDVIGTIGAQQEVDLCVDAGNQDMCKAMLLTSTVPNTNYVRLQPFNLASWHTKGYDIEASYRMTIGDGTLTLRALGTHNISFMVDSGLPNTIPTDSAGVNIGSTPDWKVMAVQSWDTDKWGVSLTEHWVSDGVYSNEVIECQTNCPVATVTHPTANVNHMDGTLRFDLGANYKFTDNLTGYAKIDNLLNKDPAVSPGTGTVANPMIYDLIGRMYRVGLRFQF
ncbi:TonB-dependent receptor plug domain-containing protein [Cellvibrio sp.]|uniref:TonB-dependent receptor plug domain-containing protein n=1 Tax=Cellvibrio sp. TaxID=1965322 RepID=UPI003964802B